MTNMMDFGLRGRHAVVTGGSRGIGRAVVLALARQGARVTACYLRDSDEALSLGKELADLGAEHLLLRANVASADDMESLFAAAARQFGPVHVLVNNAGVVSNRPLPDLEPTEWHRVLDTNLTAMYLATRAALPRLAPGASIVNVTSAVAMRGMAARAHYTASKAGVLGLTRSLCKELGGQRVRVNAVAPGLVETDQMAELPAAARTKYRGMIALARFADPADIAGSVLFLASDAARYISGATLNVDGGI
jgi:3-oxoacyl-[acyl-carrier protein] reductase